MALKPGDRVVCVDDGVSSVNNNRQLKRGNIYFIAQVIGNDEVKLVAVIGGAGGRFSGRRRFIPFPE